MKHATIKEKAQAYAAVYEQCLAYMQVRKPRLRTPENVHAWAWPLMLAATGNMQESFFVGAFDTKMQPLAPPQEITRGTVDMAPTEIGGIFRWALLAGAVHHIVLLHNHPSNDPTPSADDVGVTRRIVEAGRILGVHVMDHLVCGNPTADNPSGYVSMREKNLVVFE